MNCVAPRNVFAGWPARSELEPAYQSRTTSAALACFGATLALLRSLRDQPIQRQRGTRACLLQHHANQTSRIARSYLHHVVGDRVGVVGGKWLQQPDENHAALLKHILNASLLAAIGIPCQVGPLDEEALSAVPAGYLYAEAAALQVFPIHWMNLQLGNSRRNAKPSPWRCSCRRT